MAVTVFSGTFMDYDFEKSVFTVNGTPVTAANFDAQVALQLTLIGAVDDVSLGNAIQSDFSNILRVSNEAAQNPVANREAKWIVSYEDTTSFKKYTTELPVADLSLRDANSEVVYTSISGGVDALFDDLVTAFEAYVLSPTQGAVNVLEIRSVGRNT